MNENKNKSINEFLNNLSSDLPAPGGGGAAALAGAIGISLGNMVAELTKGKKKYLDVEEEIKELSKKAILIRDELLNLIDKDAEGFLPLIEAYKIPAESDEEKENKNRIIEDLSVEACAVPVKIIKKCAESLDIVYELAKKGSVMALSDAGCAAVLIKSAMQSAALNVFINTKGLKNRSMADKLNNEVSDLLIRYTSFADDIYNDVLKKLYKSQ